MVQWKKVRSVNGMQEPFYNPYVGVYKRAVELFNEESFHEAFQKFSAVVENDKENYNACYYLGECYFRGLGTEKNLTKAYENYAIAAIHQNISAKYMLGLCYEFGYGVAEDKTQAVAWYLEATKVDHSAAQFRLGLCYKEGVGINKSIPLAASWLLRAAQKGDMAAQREAAKCYELLNQPHAAATLFLAAAEQGDPLSEEKIASYYADGYGCPVSEDLAIEYYRRASDHGNVNATLSLAHRFAIGKGIEQSKKNAIALWLKVASNSTEAQFALADCYFSGDGVMKDVSQGMKWLEKAARENSMEAMMRLAEYSMKPLTEDAPDASAAKFWWTKAAALGNAEAMYQLGKCYEEGIAIITPNLNEAYRWYRLASQKGNEAATEACKKFVKTMFGNVKFKRRMNKKK